jgi:hypothetical protein
MNSYASLILLVAREKALNLRPLRLGDALPTVVEK